ncbi:hypothetical protein EJ05DRAFT_505396 [Pseudovirgaria hyperparasitica]|uniref:Large ribosomal subunit protein mL59 domain-containing protein n=1 Tax=Pseudovirgaria hyperparasitica TaxID=470096 RepID=A0A6A6VV16_9PEZI|nr:uncharacterized protein EJ05DRAFT_446693 [Pseudovirgaria hyperparasitica]XP_033595542.1 uncharacterized protein EJ05DRAFT_505396 [Pseudovirgaria hyperparasitica]KAF2752426.1 hypothetical protein EJ05DRAFT_446693 [Pseudovirgaria hyperparasitica]KAF2753091.1 hypothetical protein EJ05DRAFT_505396 [Pseudovirgaria hyperparasitica]
MVTIATIQPAPTLPSRLLRFFAKYPPVPIARKLAETGAYESADLDLDKSTVSTETTSLAFDTTALTATSSCKHSRKECDGSLPYRSPFAPQKNFVTGKWRGPIYGLRQQADICKLARAYEVEDWLPWSIKKQGEREKRRIERGLQVRGTGVGQKPKGKKWERQLGPKLEKRRQAMLEMPQLIKEWRLAGRSRGWKKWPK